MTEERDGWTKGGERELGVTGEYWVVRDLPSNAGRWCPDVTVCGTKDCGAPGFWYKLKEAAPPRPEPPKPKIEDLLEEGRAYWCVNKQGLETVRFWEKGCFTAWLGLLSLDDELPEEIYTIEDGQKGRRLK